MGISICIYNPADDELSDEIWQSCYSTYDKFVTKANSLNPNIIWPKKFKRDGENFWSYEDGFKLAQDLMIIFTEDDSKLEKFIDGLMRAYTLKLDIIIA